nr:MAG TPA: hypothetical protein [Caudoviricetes sp.]
MKCGRPCKVAPLTFIKKYGIILLENKGVDNF